MAARQRAAKSAKAAADECGEAFAQLRHAVAEFGAGAFPVGVRRLDVGEEQREHVDELLGLYLDANIERNFAVLHEEGAARLPEKDILGRVAELKLGTHLVGEIVMVVFGFDHAVGNAVVVEENAVELERRATFAGNGVFANESPLERTCHSFNQGIERGANGGFVSGTDIGQLRKGEVVTANSLVGRLEGEVWRVGARRGRGGGGDMRVVLLARSESRDAKPDGAAQVCYSAAARIFSFKCVHLSFASALRTAMP